MCSSDLCGFRNDMFTRSQYAARESAKQKRQRALFIITIRECDCYHAGLIVSPECIGRQESVALGLLFSLFIVNPALKGWAIFVRRLTRTSTPSVTVGLLVRLLI